MPYARKKMLKYWAQLAKISKENGKLPTMKTLSLAVLAVLLIGCSATMFADEIEALQGNVLNGWWVTPNHNALYFDNGDVSIYAGEILIDHLVYSKVVRAGNELSLRLSNGKQMLVQLTNGPRDKVYYNLDGQFAKITYGPFSGTYYHDGNK